MIIHLTILTLILTTDPNAEQQTTTRPQQLKTANLARFSWEMNPLLKNPDGPSDVSFSLTLTPQSSSDIITGSGLWRVGVFGSKVESGVEPRTSYQRQVLNQLHTSQPLGGSAPTTFDIQTQMDMREMGCGPYKYFCVEFAKGDNPQPDFNIPLNGGVSLVNCQHIPCRSKWEPNHLPPSFFAYFCLIHSYINSEMLLKHMRSLILKKSPETLLAFILIYSCFE